MEKIKIVLVEDDEILSKVVEEELSSKGFGVLKAMDGEAGLEMIKSEKPDLVLLDLVLPKLNGIEVLKKLREDEFGKNVPVIILSVVSDMDKVADAMEGGVYTYLIKDKMNIGDLAGRIKEELEK